MKHQHTLDMNENKEIEKDAKRDADEHEIIEAALEVFKVLGKGFDEKVYQEAMALELTARGVPYFREPRVPIYYKQNQLTRYYQPDFICFNHIVVELKAIPVVGEEESAQLLRYLKASKLTKALLLNFGEDRLATKRVAFVPPATSAADAPGTPRPSGTWFSYKA